MLEIRQVPPSRSLSVQHSQVPPLPFALLSLRPLAHLPHQQALLYFLFIPFSQPPPARLRSLNHAHSRYSPGVFLSGLRDFLNLLFEFGRGNLFGKGLLRDFLRKWRTGGWRSVRRYRFGRRVLCSTAVLGWLLLLSRPGNALRRLSGAQGGLRELGGTLGRGPLSIVGAEQLLEQDFGVDKARISRKIC